MHLATIRQIKIIADLLRTATLPDGVQARHFNGLWREYFTWCCDWLDLHPPEADLLRYTFSQAFRYRSAEDIRNYTLLQKGMNVTLNYPTAASVLAEVDAVRWLWPGWLLRGLPSLLAAVPGTGKSYLALDLARRLITGEPFPDGAPVSQPGPVLYVDAENTPSIHKQRLSIWHPALLERLYIMLPPTGRFIIDLNTPADRDNLCDMAWSIRPVLIIIDSYGSVTLKGENNKEDVQNLLAFFNQLAQDFDCGVLIIHHLRKGSAAEPYQSGPLTLDSIRGSSHIGAMARQIWGLQFVPTGPEPSASDPRQLWVVKSNVGPAPRPLGVNFSPHPGHPEVAQLTFGDAPRPYQPPTRLDECAGWLREELAAAGEPLRPAEILKRARDAGYYHSLVYRARQHLGDEIADTHRPRHPRNAWTLPENQDTDDAASAEPAV